MTRARSSIRLVLLVCFASLAGGTAFGCATSSNSSTTPETASTEAAESTSSTPEEAHDALGSDYDLEGQVLVVLSGAGELTLDNGETIETGFFMNELAIPARAMDRAGLELVYATPNNETPRMDPSSDDPSFFESKEEYQRYRDFLEKEGLTDGSVSTESFEDVLDEGLDEYAAVFVPGGLAPTVDLATSKPLGQILKRVHEDGKTTAMLCHGPAALLSTLESPKTFIEAVHAGKTVDAPKGWPYAGYTLTVISEKEDEATEEKLGGGLKFYPEPVLRAAGADVEVRKREKGFVTQHEELITGQNPLADREFTRRLLEHVASRQSESEPRAKQLR